MEGLEPKILSGNKAFCESHKGFEQETSCNKLTNYNCNLTSCSPEPRVFKNGPTRSEPLPVSRTFCIFDKTFD